MGWKLSDTFLMAAIVEAEEQCPFLPEDQHHVLVVLLRMARDRGLI